MSRMLAIGIAAGLSLAAAQAQVSVRYFLSLQGLSNPNNTDSAAVAPILGGPAEFLGSGTARFYIWADISASPNPTDLKGFTLGFRTTGNVQITRTNIWQNNFTLPGFARWNAAGFPGEQTWNSSTATPGTTVAVLEPGITNGAFSTFDDQFVAGRALVGYVEVAGPVGTIDIVHHGSGFLQGSSNTNRVFLGFDDVIGNPAEVVGQPYDTPQYEGGINIPEPASLILLAVAASFAIRRR